MLLQFLRADIMRTFAAIKNLDTAPRPARSITGFALWDTLLLVALIAALLVVAFVSQQAYIHLRVTQQQAATVLWADQQVAGFAVSHRRLPCPDINGDGLEDCGAGSTAGALPLLTLGLQADAATRGPINILYTVDRPLTMDLAVLASYFEPQQWDGTKYSYGNVNGLDFCGKLADIVSAAADTTAYTVGLKRKDGEADLVRSHSAADISNSLSCVTTMSSVNGIALAVDVVNEVLAQQQSTNQSAKITIAFNVLHVILTAVDVALSGVALANSIETEAESAALLAAAIVSCIVLVGCAEIPPLTAAVVAAGVAIGLSGVAIGLSAAAIITLVASTGLAIDVAIKTGNDPGNQTLDINLSDMNAAATKAENQANADEAKAASAYTTMQNKATDRNNAYNAITTADNAVDPQHNHDALVTTATTDAVALDNAQQAKDQAQGDLDQANKKVSQLTDSYTHAQTNCAGATLPAEQYKCDAVARVHQQLLDAQAAVGAKQTALNNANTQLVAAQSAYNAALQAITNTFAGNASGAANLVGAINNYKTKYAQWQNAVAGYNVLHQTALDSRNSATQARNVYNQLAYNLAHPGTTPTGSAITVWAGAAAILQQADANGVVQ